MQAENNKNNIKTLSFGCRLNALECEKIKNMLQSRGICAVVVNTCSVTGEAERQCGQTVRNIARENPNAIIFVTGCGETRNPDLFRKIPGVIVIPNADKMKPESYIVPNNIAAPACELDVKVVAFAPELLFTIMFGTPAMRMHQLANSEHHAFPALPKYRPYTV